MAKTRKTAPREAAADPSERLHDVLIAAAWEPALRLALEFDGALERCNRRACRTACGCCLQWKEGEPLGCGGGVSDETVRMAAALVFFGSVMVMRYLDDVAIPERMELKRRLGVGDARLGGADDEAIH